MVNARWPTAVTGFLMPFEKIMNSIYEIWSGIMPNRAIACAFNLEYLLTGGRDLRTPASRSSCSTTGCPAAGAGATARMAATSPPPASAPACNHSRSRGRSAFPHPDQRFQSSRIRLGPANGAAASACARPAHLGEADRSVISYICDRERAIVWGIEGGLPSMPHGLSLKRNGSDAEEWLGSVFSDVPHERGRVQPTHRRRRWLRRPLERDPALVGRCRGRLRLHRTRPQGLRRRAAHHRRGPGRIRGGRSRHRARA